MGLFKKFISLIIILLTGFFLFYQKALAICPVCTIAVGAGVGLCRWLGIDDLISGVWVGGLILSVVIWILNWFEKKGIRFLFRKILVLVFFYLIVFVPLYWLGISGHPLNKFLGMDKLLFGTISGSFAFLISIWLHKFLLNKNQGKAFFPFQKVVLPLLFLSIASLIFWPFC